jgi:hypothetical protein
MGSSQRQLLSAFTDSYCPSLVIPSVQDVMPGDEAPVWRLRFAAFGLVGALLAVWLFITSAQAAQIQPRVSVEQIESFEYGIYEPMRGMLPKGVPPYSVDDKQLVGVTNVIPAQLGIEFGFRYRIVGHPKGAPIAVKTVILFPSAGVVSPTEGLLHSSSLLKPERIGQLKIVVYKIEKPWELVPGIWTIQLWVGSQKFAEQAFNVMPQQTAMN